jgi:hypothetical protein
MRTVATAILFAALASTTAFAESNWDKSYNVSGTASLQVGTDDASTRVQSCGGCRTVHIRVDGRGQDLSRWHITEMQGGNGIQFSMKRVDGASNWFHMGGNTSPEVVIETPQQTTLQLHTGNGSTTVTGLHGNVDVRSGNGTVQLEDVSGELRTAMGNGSLSIRRAEGTLSISGGNGTISAEGRFSQFESHTGNGTVHLTLLPGSVLAASSHITTGNSNITLQLPRDLKADIQASNGNGGIHNSLPLLTTAVGRNSLHGSLNGGGPTIKLQAGNGGINISGQ